MLIHRIVCTGCSAVLLLATATASKAARPDRPRIRWIWSGSPNASIDLSKGRGARFGQTERRITYDDGPDKPWTEIQPVGICRVKFDGVEYIGTVRRGNLRGRVYMWSADRGRYVETKHAGRGQKCHLRLSHSTSVSESGVGTFQQFEYLDAPQSSLVEDAPLRLGTHRGRPLYACRVVHRYDEPKDTTLGRKTFRRDTVWGYAAEGSRGCSVPDLVGHQTDGVQLLGR